MGDFDEVTTLRRRMADLDREIARKGNERLGRSRAGLFQVYDAGSLPTTVPKFYATHPVSFASATESEGGTYSLTAGADNTPVLVLNRAPSVGDYLIAKQIGGYWVSDREGVGGSGPATGGGIPGCLCTSIPLTLSMTPGGFCENVFQACTLQWGPTPPELAELPLGTHCFLSNESFYHDVFQSYYRWHLFCNTALFGVKRAYPAQSGYSAFLDATFFAWTIGLPGNQCTPFLLSNGRIFPGGDLRCTLTIAEVVP